MPVDINGYYTIRKKYMNRYTDEYNPPFFLKSGHIQTIIPTLFRKVKDVIYHRERIYTIDDDFLDIDWSFANNGQCDMRNSALVIISHGLEGNSTRAYVKGMVRACNYAGLDCIAWNYRSCSGEPNRQLYSYHSGATQDLALVIDHAKKTGKYSDIFLVGFSLGGNLTLVYLGRDVVDPIVKKAVVFSVPCDLEGSSIALSRPVNRFYMKRFLIMLHDKIKAKMAVMPGKIDDNDFHEIKNFKDFDDRYTAPLNGFKDALDYWHKCSSRQFIKDIRVRTLIVNAKDDPCISESCFPIEEAAENPWVSLEIPKWGGHVGFMEINKDNIFWSEKRAVRFFRDI